MTEERRVCYLQTGSRLNTSFLLDKFWIFFDQFREYITWFSIFSIYYIYVYGIWYFGIFHDYVNCCVWMCQRLSSGNDWLDWFDYGRDSGVGKVKGFLYPSTATTIFSSVSSHNLQSLSNDKVMRNNRFPFKVSQAFRNYNVVCGEFCKKFIDLLNVSRIIWEALYYYTRLEENFIASKLISRLWNVTSVQFNTLLYV